MLTKIKTNHNEGIEINEYVCLSSDDKPTDCGNGSVLHEMDTDKDYYYNAEVQGWIASGESKYLKSLAITTPPTKVAYVDGEDFDSTGAVVKATYTDNSNATVSTSVVWPEKVHFGETKAIVSYTENGITKTAEQSITVTEEEEE